LRGVFKKGALKVGPPKKWKVPNFHKMGDPKKTRGGIVVSPKKNPGVKKKGPLMRGFFFFFEKWGTI